MIREVLGAAASALTFENLVAAVALGVWTFAVVATAGWVMS